MEHGKFYPVTERVFNWIVDTYGRTLNVVLDFAPVTMAILIATIALTVCLFFKVPKGFFPQQDNGRVMGSIWPIRTPRSRRWTRSCSDDRHRRRGSGRERCNGFYGRRQHSARMFISLKPLNSARATAQEIIARLRPKLGRVPGATLYLQASQDVRIGGRSSSAEYQFTMQGDNLPDLINYSPKMLG